MKYTTKDFYSLNQPASKFYPFQKMRRLWIGLKFFFGCLTVIRDPRKTDSVLRTAQGMITTERFAYALNHLKSLPGGVALLKNKELLPPMNLKTLSKYPTGSLGFAYAQHMLKNNLDPDFYNVEFSDEITYSFYRYGKIHDLLHLLTGFDTSIAGEMGVLGYSYAQNRGPGLILASALTLLHGVLFKPRELYSYLQNFVEGWQLGQKSGSFFTYDWQSALHQSVAQVQNDLGIARHGLDEGRIYAPIQF